MNYQDMLEKTTPFIRWLLSEDRTNDDAAIAARYVEVCGEGNTLVALPHADSYTECQQEVLYLDIDGEELTVILTVRYHIHSDADDRPRVSLQEVFLNNTNVYEALTDGEHLALAEHFVRMPT